MKIKILKFPSLMMTRHVHLYMAATKTRLSISCKEAIVSAILDEPAPDDEHSKFYIPEVIKYLLRYLLAFYPLWSRYQ